MGGASSTQQASDESIKVTEQLVTYLCKLVCYQSSATPSDQHDPVLSDNPPSSSHDPAAHSKDPPSCDQAPPPATEHRYIYRGGSNVICIQLFCMDEAYEMR